jgi:hypothetical protein
MGVQEGDSFVRHLLKVGCLDLAVGVGRRDVPDSEVVGEYEDDVGKLMVVGVKKTAQYEQREKGTGNHGWVIGLKGRWFLTPDAIKGKERLGFG